VWGKQNAVAMLEAGFGDVRVGRIENDPLNTYYIAKR
jgi:hypothetical protein